MADLLSTSDKGPRVSVFVPSYNHARFVGRTLESIIKQTQPPDELLVIDDGSKDGSVAVIEETLNKCPFPSELLSRPNRGLSATLNQGLAKTSGDLFAYIGSDDLWLPEFLESRTALLCSRSDAVLAHGNAYTIDENDRVIEDSTDYATYVDDNARPLLDRSLGPISSTVCYRRSAVEKFGWNEKAKLEDLELYLYLSYEGTFAFDPSVLSTWRLHGSNTSADVEWMLSEAIAAQRRVATAIGLPDSDLERIVAQTSLEYSLLLARRGAPGQALELLWKNWSRSPNLIKLIKVLGHCALPSAIKDLKNNHTSEIDVRFESATRMIRGE